MTAVATKPVGLICAWCKEEWTFYRPKGKRGPNPVTNPDHAQCGGKRQNQNRAIRRQQKRQGIEYETWNIRPADKAENLTVEEETARRDVIERPWWRSCRTADLNGGYHLYLWDEWRSDALAEVDSIVRYSTEVDRKAVDRWFLESRAAKSGDYLGQTASAKRKLAVIGSARPWREAEQPGALLCTRGIAERMKPFSVGG
ncbi:MULTISPECIES: hypothetical protein [unclassified Streptomyces]|uniref:hypothetical protein n=1 Tax=unclassified Streptomyces TaxID=2593676 RepID=UPI001319D3C1|nr:MULTISPECIES: hypothetical protein [unclassified Streptomyces]MYT33805.1 hypothetical protein [Streptomyces sp. SID8354]